MGSEMCIRDRSGLTAVPENGQSSASGALPPVVRPAGDTLLLSNARSAPSSLSTTGYLSRGVKEEEAEMFASHDLAHVEPAELHTLLAQIAAPHSKAEPQDGAFAQLEPGLNAPSPHCFSSELAEGRGASTGGCWLRVQCFFG